MSYQLQLPEVPRHTYPLSIKIASVLCIVIFCLFIYELPSIVAFDARYKKAELAFQRKKYDEAFIQFYELNKEVAGYNQIRLRLAQMLFLQEEDSLHQIAMNYLQGMKLNNENWQELVCFMPAKYIELFDAVEGKS